MKKMSIVTMAVLCTLGLTGCYTADSGNYATELIFCGFTVDVDKTIVTATASFWVEGAQPANPTYLVLTAGDTVMVNGTTMQRKRGPLFDIYTATLQPAETYTFNFARTDGTSYDSTVNTIATLDITSPEEGALISRAADMNIAWTNPIEGGNVAVFIPGGQYFNGYLKETADTGVYTIPAENLTLDALSLSTDVETALSISRNHKGTMATGLNGNVTARTGSNIQIVSTE